MHAGGEHGHEKGMKGAKSVRERERFILKGTVFIWNESSIKAREEPGESGGDKQREEKVKRQLKTRKRNGTTEQGRDKKE